VEKWQCSVCGYIYDPEKGDPMAGIPAGTPFEALPRAWSCPRCNARKEKFHPGVTMTEKPSLLARLYYAEDIAYYFIAFILFFSAMVLIGIAVMHLMKGLTTINILNVVNDVLLVVILLEIFSTVLIYLTERRISLTPFLLIGVISSIRRILMVSAMMSVQEDLSAEMFDRALKELTVSTGIVIALIAAYYVLTKVLPTAERCVGCLGVEPRDETRRDAKRD